MYDYDYDVVAFGAHPDDVELGCGGTLARLVEQGKKVAVVDLTRGESATKGTPEIREKEARLASEVLGISERINLGLPDARLIMDDAHLMPVVEVLRRLRPKVVISQWQNDRHPDHEASARIVKRACYLAGIGNLEVPGELVRPARVICYPLFYDFDATFAFDITETFEKKIKAIECFRSQFFQDGEEKKTLISHPLFMEKIKSRALYYGSLIRRRYAEPFWMPELPVVESLDVLRNDL